MKRRPHPFANGAKGWATIEKRKLKVESRELKEGSLAGARDDEGLLQVSGTSYFLISNFASSRLAAGVGVIVAPRPVFALFFVVEVIELAIFVMAFGEPHVVRAFFVVVPVVRIGIVGVVNADSGGAATNGKRSQRGGSQQDRTEEAF